jgi:hypothetical protein
MDNIGWTQIMNSLFLFPLRNMVFNDKYYNFPSPFAVLLDIHACSMSKKRKRFVKPGNTQFHRVNGSAYENMTYLSTTPRKTHASLESIYVVISSRTQSHTIINRTHSLHCFQLPQGRTRAYLLSRWRLLHISVDEQHRLHLSPQRGFCQKM